MIVHIGFAHRREVSPFKPIPGLSSIDIVHQDRMVAIECDLVITNQSILGDWECREKFTKPGEGPIIANPWTEHIQHQKRKDLGAGMGLESYSKLSEPRTALEGTSFHAGFAKF